MMLFLALTSTAAFAFVDLKEELFKEMGQGQLTLTYTEARVKLFNVLDLQKDAKGHFVKGVYCDDKFYHYRQNETPGIKIPDGNIMNTEHTWPQSKFNRAFPETTQKTDLHHLYPSYSKINAERGNYPFAEVIPSPIKLFCTMSQLGKASNTGLGVYFEPSDDHKGNVARSMFYFSTRYKLAIDPVQEYYLRQWHILDPVDANEKTRHEKIVTIQKNRNPFIDDPGLVNQILDF